MPSFLPLPPIVYALGPGYPFALVCVYAVGAALGVVGGFLLLVNLIRALRPEWGFLDPLARSHLARGWGDGPLLGIGVGLLAGIAFNLAQIPRDYVIFLPPRTPVAGVFCGGSLGILAGILGGRLRSLPRNLVVGVAAGVGGGLLTLELIAQLGKFTLEAAIGVGPAGSELALWCGIFGGLIGALLATLVGDALEHTTHHWRETLIGTTSGLVAGLAVAFLGVVGRLFVLAVPADLVALGWRNLLFWQGAGASTQGVLYGFVAFGMIGLLCGGVVGGLATTSSRIPSDTGQPIAPLTIAQSAAQVTFVLGLLLGLIGGLSLGLAYKLLGGQPGSALSASHVLSTNPHGSVLALVVSSLGGIAVGVCLALVWNRSDREPNRSPNTGKTSIWRTGGAGLVLLLLGGVIFWLPNWFSPLVYLLFGGH